MVKWVRKQLQALKSFRGGDTGTVLVAALMPRVSKRMATISSVGFTPWAEPQTLALTRNLPPPVRLAARRPGVDSRWKEQNRLAFKRSL